MRCIMTTHENKLSALAHTAADRLSALRSEAALQLHLAGMEATETWNEMKPELDDLEAKLKEAASGQVALEVHLALMEAKDRYNKLEPRVQSVVDRIGL